VVVTRWTKVVSLDVMSEVPNATPAREVRAGGTIRFAVGSPTGLRSSTWCIWSAKHTKDVYLAARSIAGLQKVSLHESQSWSHSFVSDERAKPFVTPGSSRRNRQVLWIAGSHDHAATSLISSAGTSLGRSTSLPFSNLAPARTSATRCGPLTARQRLSAASRSLNTIASPACLLPGPLVTRVRARTGENVLSMGLVTGMKGGGCRLRPPIGWSVLPVGRGVRCDRPGQGHLGANAGWAGR